MARGRCFLSLPPAVPPPPLLLPVLLVVLLASALPPATAFFAVDTATRQIVDEAGRARVFHGVNAVYKVPPYHPTTGGFDPEESLGPRDAELLAGLGLNVVRLGVMWPAVTPTPGAVNTTYLQVLQSIVKQLGDAGIATILDCHQDLLSRQFCGEGAPDFAVSLGQRHNATFPHPVAKEIQRDPDGRPTLQACLQRPFGSYYATYDVGRAFQELYTNETTKAFFGAYWTAVAERFRDDPNVLGYELLNEPFLGAVEDHPEQLLPGHTDRHLLQPLYDEVFRAIAAADPNHLVLYEGVPVLSDVLPPGFEHGPGGSNESRRHVLAYHVYCPFVDANGVPTSRPMCDDWDERSVTEVAQAAARLGGGAMITEFGALDDSAAAGEEVRAVADLADGKWHGWVYWTYKGYHDITTANTAGTETLFFPNGTLQQTKAWYLSRTYAQAVAGVPIAMRFDTRSGNFSLSYNHTVAAQPTVVYLNEGLHYAEGFLVTLQPPAANWTHAAENRIEIRCDQCATMPQRVDLQITGRTPGREDE